MLTLLIDNYDSFTYNLFQLLAEVNGREPLVVRNDEASWAELERLDFDNVVISPGPGRPERDEDFGVCAEAIRHCEKPLLGVCLGLQGIGWVEGGRVERAPEPMHGRVAAIEHDGTPLFTGIPSPFRATRYHSLSLAHPLPPSLREIATADGVPMAIEHRDAPPVGRPVPPRVDRHRARKTAARELPRPHAVLGARACRFCYLQRNKSDTASFDRGGGSEDRRVSGSRERVRLPLRRERACVLARQQPPREREARFSFMGDASGPLAQVITHEGGAVGEPLLDRLQRRLDELRPAELPDLPFEFDCGFVGYLGYELKAECGYESPHDSEHPDAAFILSRPARSPSTTRRAAPISSSSSQS